MLINFIRKIFASHHIKTCIKPSIVLERDKHPISRKQISCNAIKVLYRLHNNGYQSYLVGGAVRDLLLGIPPKDFDVTTNATPEAVHKLFNNCRLIGRRFRLAHIHFGREIIEVATFRAQKQDDEPRTVDGMLLHDNTYGTLEQDVERRDFTINALYYNIADFTVLDYFSGLEDLKQQQVRLIGDPITRYREDPVRMLRAIRFAAKLDFKLHPDTEEPIATTKDLLQHIPHARLLDEYHKCFMLGYAQKTYQLLQQYDLLNCFIPSLDIAHDFVLAGLRKTDNRIAEGKPIAAGFLLAVFLWPLYKEQLALHSQKKMPQHVQMEIASENVFTLQRQTMAIPKKVAIMIKEIWHLQAKFTVRNTKGIQWLSNHPRFRAAYDFMLLRAEVEQDPLMQKISNRWKKIVKH